MRILWSMFLRSVLIILCVSTTAQAMQVETVESSGLKALLIHESSVPVFSLQVTFTESGSAHDPAGKEGLAVLASTLMNEGAGDLDALAFQHRLERHAIQLYGVANEDQFSISLESLSRERDTALSMLSLAITDPRFDPEPTARMRSELIAGLKRLEESPAYIAARAWYQAAYGDHPYAKPSRGTASSLAAITRADLMQFAKRHFTKDTIRIAAAGDISKEELAAFLDRLAAALPAAVTQPAALAPVVVDTGAGEIHIEKHTPQTVVMMGLPGISRTDPDFFPAFVLNQTIGGGELNSTLMQALRHDKGLVYSVSSSLDTMSASALWMLSFSSSNERVAEALTRTRETIQRIAQQGISDQELEETKRFLTGSFPLQLDSNEALVGYLMLIQQYDLGSDYLTRRNEFIRAVTKDQVKAVAKRLLSAAPLTVTVGSTQKP